MTGVFVRAAFESTTGAGVSHGEKVVSEADLNEAELVSRQRLYSYPRCERLK
jgi:hypothetical protein